jgi:hypothetical protein
MPKNRALVHLGSFRIWLLSLGIAISIALVASVSATYYAYRSVAESTGVPARWQRIVDIGSVADPIDVETLWPIVDTAPSFEQVTKRLPAGEWAAVEAAAARSVTESPLNSRMWLVLAVARAARHDATANVASALKMSYDTGPNDMIMLPQRLLLSVALDFSSDAELTAAIQYELRRAFSAPQPFPHILVNAHCSAVPQARKLIDDIALAEGVPKDTWDKAC